MTPHLRSLVSIQSLCPTVLKSLLCSPPPGRGPPVKDRASPLPTPAVGWQGLLHRAGLSFRLGSRSDYWLRHRGVAAPGPLIVHPQCYLLYKLSSTLVDCPSRSPLWVLLGRPPAAALILESLEVTAFPLLLTPPSVLRSTETLSFPSLWGPCSNLHHQP